MISTGSDFTVGGVAGSGPTYSSELMFTSLKTSQAGVYTCSATHNSVTSMSTTPVSVTSMLLSCGTIGLKYTLYLNLCTPPPVPPPSVAVTASPDRILYDGESVTLTCTITLDPAVDSVIYVTASWAGPDGAISDGVSGVTGSGPYQSTLTLPSLVTSDTGVYACTASVGTSTPQVVASEDVTDTHTITVGKEIGYFFCAWCLAGYLFTFPSIFPCRGLQYQYYCHWNTRNWRHILPDLHC